MQAGRHNRSALVKGERWGERRGEEREKGREEREKGERERKKGGLSLIHI